jgi:hypothetical protein
MHFSLHQAIEDITAIKLVYSNVRVVKSAGQGVGIETADAGTVTRTASVEPVVDGARYQATFGGNTSDVRPAQLGANGIVESDWIAVPTISAGTWFGVNSYHAGTVGCAITQAVRARNGEKWALGAAVADQTMSGRPTGAAGVYSAMPVAILGMTAKGSVLISGNSRTRGVSDTSTATGLNGEIARSLGTTIGQFHIGTPGDTIMNLALSHSTRALFARYVSSGVIFQDCVNELSRTPSQILADYQTMIAAFGLPFYACTTAPYTTGAASAVDGSDQTPRANDATRVSVNTSIRAGLPGAAGYFDVAAAASIDGKQVWKSGYSTDLLHAIDAGVTGMVASGVIPTAPFVRG